MIGLQVINLGVGDLKVERATGSDPLRYKIFYYLSLGINGHGPAAGQLAEVDVVPLTSELEVDAAVLEPLAAEPIGEPGRPQQLDAAVLDDACPLPRLAVGAAADLYDHGIDAAESEQVRQQQPGRACPDNAYLRAHVLVLS
jgi:hypothetical protein